MSARGADTQLAVVASPYGLMLAIAAPLAPPPPTLDMPRLLFKLDELEARVAALELAATNAAACMLQHRCMTIRADAAA